MKETLKKLNNYIIYSYEKDDAKWISIGTVMGDWHIEYRFDTSMYNIINTMLDDDEKLVAFCTLMFITTYTLHSSSVYEAIRDSILKEIEEVGIPQVSDDEDEEMLSDVSQFEKVSQKLKEYGEIQD